MEEQRLTWVENKLARPILKLAVSDFGHLYVRNFNGF